MGGRAGRPAEQCLEQLRNAVPNAEAPTPGAGAATRWVWADGSCGGPRMVAMPNNRQQLDPQPLLEETFVHAQQLLHEADRAKLYGQLQQL